MSIPEILELGEILTAKDRFPSRIVLRKVRERTFATHIEIHPPDGEPYFILGRYFFNLGDAQMDFRRRILELQGTK
jgi:hypothetical protein